MFDLDHELWHFHASKYSAAPNQGPVYSAGGLGPGSAEGIDRVGGRPIIVASNGLVVSGSPLASQAGLRVLQNGGNAVDAAVAASAVSAVARPWATGIGGDLFALIYLKRENQVHAINATGPGPRRATRELFGERGLDIIPQFGPLAVETPGGVAGWELAISRFGTRPLAALLEAALDYAADGYPASPGLVQAVLGGELTVAHQPGWRQTFMPEGRAPRVGETMRFPSLARSLRAIAEGGADEFYRGTLARRLASETQAAGGLLEVGDLADCRAELVEPICGRYRGYLVYEQPPVSQGVVLLLQLAILDGFDLSSMGHLSAEAVHHMVEAKKLAFEARLRWLGDPAWRDNPLDAMLSPEFVEQCRRSIDRRQAAERVEMPLLASVGADTTFLATADREGNVVAMIQSLYSAWGSGVVAGDTGILLNNRLSGFFLEPEHPNRLEPGKRTIHTLNQYMLFRAGRPFLAGGTPGADDQVQVNQQVISSVIDYGMNIQDAVEAPRWSSTPGTVPWSRPAETPYALRLEQNVPTALATGLAERGHEIELVPVWSIGSGKLIMVEPSSGALLGAGDPRREAYAVGW